VQTSVRRRVTTALAIVSRVARLASAFVSRETEVDGRESDESRGNGRPKRTLKGPVATQGTERYEILVLEAGGQGALIGLPYQSGVACIPTYAVLSRGCYQREEAHTEAQETARLKVTIREAFGPKLSPSLLPKRPRGNSDKADVFATSAVAKTGMGSRCWRGGGRGALTQPK
jgi:hypothetical protein